MFGKWITGTVNGYTYCAKVFDEGSIYGIDGGRISKLELRDGMLRIVYNYDRGIDVPPETEQVAEAVAALVKAADGR